MMISVVKFLPLACLICLKRINLASARLAPNQKFSLDSAVISDAIRDRSTSPPSEKLVPIGTLQGGAILDKFGSSVSLSYDGDALAVGSPDHNEGGLSDVGLAQVFHRRNSSQWDDAWNSTGGNKEDEFGWSTSLSGDGKWLAIGTGHPENEYAKLVETETGKEITIMGEQSGFGRSVSVSRDGNRVAVAADYDVAVFQIQEDGRIHQIGEDVLTYAWSTVAALSADGDTLAIGEPYFGNSDGRVRIFEWRSGEWKQLGGDIVGRENYGDGFGNSLDITADGHRVIIGASGSSYIGNYGKVYDYNGSDWEVVEGDLSGESNDNYKSHHSVSILDTRNSVSISDDGSRIVIGSPFFTSDGFRWRGRAVVYQYGNGAWNQIGHDILGKNANDAAGYTVAISGDGNIVSIGAPYGADSMRGYVMMYEVN